jgi:hypothetical protein
VRDGDVPDQRDVAGVAGWAGSVPVRVATALPDSASTTRSGCSPRPCRCTCRPGKLDPQTWQLLTRLADHVAADGPDQIKDSNGTLRLDHDQPAVPAIGRLTVRKRADALMPIRPKCSGVLRSATGR